MKFLNKSSGLYFISSLCLVYTMFQGKLQIVLRIQEATTPVALVRFGLSSSWVGAFCIVAWVAPLMSSSLMTSFNPGFNTWSSFSMCFVLTDGERNFSRLVSKFFYTVETYPNAMPVIGSWHKSAMMTMVTNSLIALLGNTEAHLSPSCLIYALNWGNGMPTTMTCGNFMPYIDLSNMATMYQFILSI